MNRRNFIATTGSILATASVAGCSDSGTDASGGNGGSNNGPLVVHSHSLETLQYGNVAVVGRAENVSDSTIGYAQIEVSFYDGNTRLGSGLANINNLRPGSVWEFEAMYMGMDGDRITRYEASVSP